MIADDPGKRLSFYQAIDKAEELLKVEKEQIVHAHLTGLIHPLEIEATKQAEQYYNETYGGDE